MRKIIKAAEAVWRDEEEEYITWTKDVSSKMPRIQIDRERGKNAGKHENMKIAFFTFL